MIPITILQLETLEQIWLSGNALTEDKKEQFKVFRESLINLMKGYSIGRN
jgi:hypothetical protein